MFDISRIVLTNFRSYQGEHVFEFPGSPGLYNLTGENLDNPRLGPNGVGKSSLLEAVHWCFYGRTSRGLKAGEVVCWGSRGCAVTVDAIIGDDRPQIRRTQAPNSLTIDGIAVEQSELQKLLRLSPEAFTHAVMVPQFGDSFFDLQPSAKLTLFSQIMELEYWLDRSKDAAMLSADINDSITADRHTAANRQGHLESLQQGVAELKIKEGEFGVQQDAVIRQLEDSLKQTEVQLKKHDKRTAEDKNLILKAEDKLISLTKQLAVMNGKHVNLGKVLSNALYDERSVVEKLEALKKVGSTCPVCLQSVHPSHLTNERKRLSAELNELAGKVKAAQAEVVENLEIKTKLERDVAILNQNKTDFERHLLISRQQHEQQKLAQAKARRDITNEMERLNPYTEMLKLKRRDIAKCKDELTVLEKRVAKLAEEHAAVSYWVAGFKRVRLFIIEESLRQLEVEVNNNLANLGLTAWQVEFDVERENKSGGVTKGFVVLIHAPGFDGPVRWESWSGGETQRLRLAGDLGLANLIMERAGLTGMIEFYDEPSQHLSQEGLLDLAETLHQRAIDLDKRIWIVDHHLIDYAFTGTALVTKDAEGSSIGWL